MITGTLKLTLKKDVNAEEFIENIRDEYDFDECVDIKQNTDKDGKAKVDIENNDWNYDTAVEIIENDDVKDAFGEFIDDGIDSFERGTFALVKKDGQAEVEEPVYLSQLTKEDILRLVEKVKDEKSVERD